jgi:hypothetical protein
LRILSYDKRRSLKGNVYYVSFASYADIEHADRACKGLRNVTLKPFQPLPCPKTQPKHDINKNTRQRTIPSSSIPSTASATSFSSPCTAVNFLADCHSSFITPRSDSLRPTKEILEERAMRIFGSRMVGCQDFTTMSTVQPPNIISSGPNVSHIESRLTSNEKDKEQLIDNVQSCLRAMETAHCVADELCQLYSRDILL